MQGIKADNQRIARNTAFLYVRMFVVLIVSLYVSRVVLNALGVVDFGIYNVVAGFVSLFSFLEATLSGSVQRFYNYYGTTDGESGFSKVYSASIIISIICAAVLLLVLETAGLWYVNNVMVVPPDRLKAANIVFQCSVASFMMIFVQLPFVGMIMAKERMNFYAIVNIVEVFLKLGMALVLPQIGADKLVYYGIFMLAISLTVTLLMIIYTNRSFPFLSFSRHLDRNLSRNLLGFSGWSVVGTFAFMLKGQGINMLLNFFFGPVVNAARGVAFQVNNAVGGFSSNISVAFRPQIVNSYAAGERERSISLMFRESKICFTLLAIILIPVVLEIDLLLHLWLGETIPENTQLFTVLVLVDALVCTLNTPCTQIVYATGRIKSYQIISTVINLLLLPVCFVLLKFGYPAQGVFILTIVFSIINQVACFIISGSVSGFTKADYLRCVVLRCIPVALVMIIPGIITMFMESSFLRFLIVTAATFVSAVPVVYYLVLNKNERRYVKKAVSGVFKR